jgi:hypothetical protein
VLVEYPQGAIKIKASHCGLLFYWRYTNRCALDLTDSLAAIMLICAQRLVGSELRIGM